MGWVKIEDRYSRHPKMMAVGVDGLALDVSGMCYAREHGTSGFVPDSAIDVIGPVRNAKRVAAKLVKVDRWERDDSAGGWWIHDFADYNPEDKVDEAAERRKEKARKGASARWGSAPSNAPSNAQAPPEHVLEHVPKESCKQDARNASPPVLPTYSHPNSDAVGASPPDDDDRAKPTNRRVRQAAALLADIDLAERRTATAAQPITDPDRWHQAATQRRLTTDGRTLERFAAEHPDWIAAQLADAVTTPAAPSPQPHPEDATAAAARAIEQRNAETLAEQRNHPPTDPDLARESITAARAQLPTNA